jgi:hypothetical protein
MESAIRLGPLSHSSREDETGSNISDPVSFDSDSDKVYKDYVSQNEISGSRENHSLNALLGPQSLQELIRAEQNGCVAAELSFGEGISLFYFCS